MNRTTILMVILALGTAASAWTLRPQKFDHTVFRDEGAPLFPEFTDAEMAATLDVVVWSDDDAQALRFSVTQKEGRWVIPTHHDYPADGTDQMGKAAASFVDVKMDRYYSDDASEHRAFGVLDPEGSVGEGDEKGRRITIKNAKNSVVVDIIVGKQVEGRQGFYYCRKPDEKRVYGSAIDLKVSTDFADWIEKDLLKVERDDFVRMNYDPYRVDETLREVIGRDPILAVVADESLTDRTEWKLFDEFSQVGAGTLDSVKVRGILTAMAALKIVGVRPRLPVGNDRNSRTMQMLQLRERGFFVSGQNELLGNEGMVQGTTFDGVVYSLFFGEVTYETGIALTGGVDDDKKAAGDEAGDDAAGDEGGSGGADGAEDTKKTASRFMFINVSYDPAADATADGRVPVPVPEEGEPAYVPGPQRAEQLNARFQQWFYVISDTSFQQVHKDRAELFKGG